MTHAEAILFLENLTESDARWLKQYGMARWAREVGMTKAKVIGRVWRTISPKYKEALEANRSGNPSGRPTGHAVFERYADRKKRNDRIRETPHEGPDDPGPLQSRRSGEFRRDYEDVDVFLRRRTERNED